MFYEGNQNPVPQTEELISKVEWCDKLTAGKYKQRTYESLKAYFEI